MSALLHGGPDAQGVPRWDFSTNANACGPCPQALAAVQAADATHYPDPRYTALRAQLAAFHGVVPARVLLAASASECIHRLTTWQARQGVRRVVVPEHAYGEYAQAARAWSLAVEQGESALVGADLMWACEPSSPLGGAHASWPPALLDEGIAQPLPTLVLDRAYAPLRLSGTPSLNDAQLQRVWQLFSPNKALCLTGVRAAYAIAPQGQERAVAELDAMAPSWSIGAHGVAMLEAWVQPTVQTWLVQSRATLRQWKVRQIEGLNALGWTCLPSQAPYFCARPALAGGLPVPVSQWDAWLATLRTQGVKLRDAASFGLPGLVRLRVVRPDAQDALLQALRTVNKRAGAGSAPWRRPDASETIQAPQPHTTVSAA